MARSDFPGGPKGGGGALQVAMGILGGGAPSFKRGGPRGYETPLVLVMIVTCGGVKAENVWNSLNSPGIPCLGCPREGGNKSSVPEAWGHAFSDLLYFSIPIVSLFLKI